jgi:hypothetical protein
MVLREDDTILKTKKGKGTNFNASKQRQLPNKANLQM